MKPLLRRGALVGAIVTAPVIAASYVGWRLFGWPFLPFDLFDWLARVLPGPVVTFAIDLAVTVSRALSLSSTGDAAKFADQTLAIVLACGGGAAAGAILAAVLQLSDESAGLVAAVLGGLLGGLALMIEWDLQRLPPGSIGSATWVVFTFVAWGLAFGALYERVREDRKRRPEETVASSTSAGRRRFLVRTGAAAALTSLAGPLAARLTGGGDRPSGERWSAAHVLPNAGSPVMPVPGTRPEFTPLEQHYRIDANTRAPVLRERDWRLHVGGLVERPLMLTMDDIRGDMPLHQFVTLECISNPVGGDLIGTTRWTGLSLQRVLARVVRGARASHVRITSADGFFETVSLELIDRDPRVMLAYAWDGVPLMVEHGFPLRLYVPNVYGMKQPKWITALDLLDHFEPGYWVSRGWDRDGVMKATSVVDAVAATRTTTAAGGRSPALVGGIACAGSREIARVEVRVDEGEWYEARVRERLSSTAWVVWRAEVPDTPGEHTLTVRCVESDGAAQSGMLHSKRVRLA